MPKLPLPYRSLVIPNQRAFAQRECPGPHSDALAWKAERGGVVQRPGTVAFELQYMGVVLQHRMPVRNADQGDTSLAQPLVERSLVGTVECAGGFVQNHHARLARQHPRKRQALLLTGGEELFPIVCRLQPADLLRQRL